MRRPLLFPLLVAAPLALAGAALFAFVSTADAHSTAPARSTGTTINLVAYSTPQTVVGKLIAKWQKTPAGQGVSFTQSYGSSGSQARAIVAGQPCDVAFLSTGLDINTLADAGLVTKSWQQFPYGGIAADSQVAFVVRKGNPKHIHTWSDLVKPGVKVVTPDPFSSGSAKWNVLAAYGSVRKTGGSSKAGIKFVTNLFRHVVSQDSSGSNALATFLSGEGDVLITYASEAYAALAKGAPIQFVIPKQTMLIELPMVPLRKSHAFKKAEQFIRFVHTVKAQEILGKNGYQPVNKTALAKYKSKFLSKSRLVFKISDPIFGGWRIANKVWFDPSNGRMVKIEREVGGPTS